MLTLSKIHQEIARFKYADVRFPKTDEATYWKYYFKLETYFQEQIDDIYAQASYVDFPITTKPIEEYLSGYILHYHPFDNLEFGKPELEGFWDSSPDTPFDIHILYNTNGVPVKRQRFTKIHETVHVLQFLDPEFRQFIDDFLTYETLPFDMVTKLVESVANQATAMYLVPKSELVSQYQQCNDPNMLSEYFQVSYQSIVYRLKNTGILVPT
ncbi:MAG: ImmA/IrrE family metallo-endopeptidase [Candidatus Magasanikbacteria bacterium]